MQLHLFMQHPMHPCSTSPWPARILLSPCQHCSTAAPSQLCPNLILVLHSLLLLLLLHNTSFCSPTFHRFGRLPSIFSEMQREMDALTRSFGLWDDDDFMMAPFRSSPLFDNLQRHLPAMPSAPEQMRLLRLATDIEEDDKAFTIKADIPGM
jgi:hypothetical protein